MPAPAEFECRYCHDQALTLHTGRATGLRRFAGTPEQIAVHGKAHAELFAAEQDFARPFDVLADPKAPVVVATFAA